MVYQMWTIHESNSDGAPKDAQFWLEPVSVNGSLAFFYFRFDPTGPIEPVFKDMKLYPVGVLPLPMDPLDPWHEGDEGLRIKYLMRALDIKGKGRGDPLAQRLEGTFTAIKGGKNVFSSARLYIFPHGEKDGRDWFVFDVNVPGQSQVEDGTAHGDGKK